MRNRVKVLLMIFIVLSSINLSAMTVKSIEYKGMVHISKPVALRMLEFEVGATIDKEVINESILNYFRQGYFSDIWVDFDEVSGKLTYHLTEKIVISKIEVSGWKDNDEEIRDSVIQIKKGSLYNKKKLEEAKKRIIEAISYEGMIDTVVEIEEEYFDNGSVKIKFLVNKGVEIIIQELKYSGIVGLKRDMFDDVIANKEHEFMGWLWGRNDGEMVLSDLAYDPLRIRDLYRQHGYLDADVQKPFVKVNFDNYTAKMSYQIDEGKVYTISKVDIKQLENVIEESKIREIISLAKDDVFNIKKFREDAKHIKILIADLSYAFVRVVPDLKQDIKNNTVEVIYKIIPGDKVRIRNVIIDGNNRTLDRIIRRELFLGPKDMYSYTDLKDSRNALGRIGFFESKTIEEKRINSKTMDLIVKVKEAPTGNIQLGAGYGSYGGFLMNLSVSDRNVWGSGISVGVKAEKSDKTENASFNVSNPRLNDSDFSGNFSVHNSINEYDEYDINSEGVTVGVGHRFSRFIRGSLSYSYTSNDYVVSYSGDDNLYLDYYDSFESYAKSSVTVGVSFDNTDDYYLPREGFTLSQSFEKSGLGADANFMKSRTRYAKYYGLEEYVDFDLIFRYKAKYNFVADTGYLPISERFRMGGIGSVRGYRSYSISPSLQSTDASGSVSDKKIGGTQTFSNSFELSYPFIPAAKMRLVTYLDWGFIGENNLQEFSRGGYGGGVEWQSPVGPIQFMFSRALNEKEGDRTSKFDFTMGRRF